MLDINPSAMSSLSICSSLTFLNDVYVQELLAGSLRDSNCGNITNSGHSSHSGQDCHFGWELRATEGGVLVTGDAEQNQEYETRVKRK